MNETHVNHTIRQLQREDLPSLNKLDMGYVSNIGYRVKRRTTDSEIQYALSLEPLSAPFQIEYDWDWADAENFLSHLDAGAVYGVFICDTYDACDATGHETVQLEREGTAGPQITATDLICAGMVELSFTEESNSVDIHSLYVHRPFRGRGIGKLLTNVAIRWAHDLDARAVFVTTQAVNGPAIRFYQRQGFQIAGVHDHLYHNDDLATGEVAVFMSYVIPE